MAKEKENENYEVKKIQVQKDYEIETVLRYKTSDGYTVSIVKIRSKKRG